MSHHIFTPGSSVVLAGEVLGINFARDPEHAYVRVGERLLVKFDADALPVLEFLSVPRTVQEAIEWLQRHGQSEAEDSILFLVEQGVLWWHGVDRAADVHALALLVVRPRGRVAGTADWLPNATLIEVDGTLTALPEIPFEIWSRSDGRTVNEVAIELSIDSGLDLESALSRVANWLPRLIASKAATLDRIVER